MTKRFIQLELITRRRARFAREAGRLNSRAVAHGRAEHERNPSGLAARYRVERSHPG